MTDETAPKPKSQKKTSARSEQKKPAQTETSRPPVLAWSVIALSLLIGASIAVTLVYAVLRSGSFTTLDEAGAAQLRVLADRVARVETDRSRLNTLENSVSRLESLRNSFTALQEKQESDVHRLESARPENAVKLNLAPLQERVEALERKLQSIAQVQLAENERLLALALSSLALKEALDKGAAFPGELAIVKNLLHAQSHLDGLGDYANTGVPTTIALLARFPEAAKSMLKADQPENAGFLDRTAAFFRSLVTVRKVGEVPGDDVGAILARTELRLQQGNVESAHEEFKKLSPRVQNIAAQWGKDLAARAEADRLMRELLLASAKNLQPKPANPSE